VPGGAIVSDAQLARAEYYRQTAEEIRRFARQSRFPEISKELFELADRFNRMAAFVESRQQGYSIGLAPERYPGRDGPPTSIGLTAGSGSSAGFGGYLQRRSPDAGLEQHPEPGPAVRAPGVKP
jgi:hypothetical protein